ncbi:efflux RND transporter periplasmic adaptor subunit [Croceibacterium aestuarii]|uniref:efflux RND transporter periplasmic adaptor subunit n=1 Tax=Croceibacterium aestuarii TaxID=3064139 RepID=UPI00272EAA4A|nr:efflux RND transporter periplasmic adaptor subunit [Croceibacterium sp. D39]
MEGRQKVYLGCGIAAFAVVVGALALNSDDAEGAANEARRAADLPVPRQVNLASDMPADLASPIAAPGLDAARPTDCLIEPSQVVKVNSGVEGVIQAIYVDRGDVVRRGQVVAQLRSDVDRAGAAAAQAKANNSYSVRAAETRAAYLEAVRRRSEQIGQYLAADKVEEAQSNARAAREERQALAEDQRVAQLEYVQSQRILAEKTVRSPVSGIVTERVMSPGEYRGPDASHIVTVAQVDPLFVEVFAPISELDAVHVGDPVKIIPEAPVGGEYTAKIKVIDRVFDAASGTFGMRLELPNPDYSLPAGLRCSIELASTKTGDGRKM